MRRNKDTMRSCLYGLAVGDALGVPFEFRERGTFECIGMEGFGTHDQPAGTWSDDTSMSLCLAASLKECDAVDTDDIMQRFHDWYYGNEYACDDDGAFDIGNTCRKAIEIGKPGYTFEESGNGSLMRIAPLAASTMYSYDEVREVSAITHANPIAEQTCVAYCEAISLIKAYGFQALPALRDRYGFITELPINEVKSDGYCVHTFGAALWCLCGSHSYKECVLAAVNLGGDTDTTAAVAGAMAGILYGYGGIPDEWVQALRGKDTIEACI